jgi:phage host-nuclease inhibitor protein Gam
MFSNYKSFKELKEDVSETYGSFAQLLEKFDWSIFSADGQNKVEAYAILDDCFRISRDIKSLIDAVADEICTLEKEMTPDDAAEKTEVIKILANYIVDNCDDELTDGRREFDRNHRTRGC